MDQLRAYMEGLPNGTYILGMSVGNVGWNFWQMQVHGTDTTTKFRYDAVFSANVPDNRCSIACP